MAETISKTMRATRQAKQDELSKGFALLDQICPLAQGSHAEVRCYLVYYHHLLACFAGGRQVGLAKPEQFVALTGHKEQPSSLLLKSGDSHIALLLNPLPTDHCSSVKDIQLETRLALQDEASEHASIWISLCHGLPLIDRPQQRAFSESNGEEYCFR